jgi:hypothetical protein
MGLFGRTGGIPKTATPTAKNIVCKICVAAPLLLGSVEPKPAFWPTNPPSSYAIIARKLGRRWANWSMR